jgi:hypothetical protein
MDFEIKWDDRAFESVPQDAKRETQRNIERDKSVTRAACALPGSVGRTIRCANHAIDADRSVSNETGLLLAGGGDVEQVHGLEDVATQALRDEVAA